MENDVAINGAKIENVIGIVQIQQFEKWIKSMISQV